MKVCERFDLSNVVKCSVRDLLAPRDIQVRQREGFGDGMNESIGHHERVRYIQTLQFVGVLELLEHLCFWNLTSADVERGEFWKTAQNLQSVFSDVRLGEIQTRQMTQRREMQQSLVSDGRASFQLKRLQLRHARQRVQSGVCDRWALPLLTQLRCLCRCAEGDVQMTQMLQDAQRRDAVVRDSKAATQIQLLQSRKMNDMAKELVANPCAVVQNEALDSMGLQ